MKGRRLLVGLIVFVIAAPITFIGFAMGLVVVEFVTYPTVIPVISVVTALVASWAADRLAADGLNTDLDQAVARNLAWALVPAAVAVFALFGPAAALLLFFVVIWMVVAATTLAFRYRRAKTSTGRRLAQSGIWLLGTGLTTATIVLVASLFGLTGA